MHVGNFTHPETNINNLHLSEGMRVADLGAGSGFLSFALAKRVGRSGKVYAIDIQKDLIERLKRHATELGLGDTVLVIWGDVDKREGTKLANESIDAAVLSNVMFQLEDKKSCVEEVKRILKPGGEVLLIDWSESFSNLGPPRERVVRKEDMEKYFLQSGFMLDREFSAGAHHYGFVFKKGP